MARGMATGSMHPEQTPSHALAFANRPPSLFPKAKLSKYQEKDSVIAPASAWYLAFLSMALLSQYKLWPTLILIEKLTTHLLAAVCWIITTSRINKLFCHFEVLESDLWPLPGMQLLFQLPTLVSNCGKNSTNLSIS